MPCQKQRRKCTLQEIKAFDYPEHALFYLCMCKLSIVIPVLNEEKFLTVHKEALSSLLSGGHEILIVDGGSKDHSIEVARELGCRIFSTKASRGYQLHFGAERSRNEILLFLHADTLLPFNAIEVITRTLSMPGQYWGRFNVRFSNSKLVFRLIAWMMNKRSCLTGIVTGDHSMFIRRKCYFDCGGYSDIPIMEDVELSLRLKKIAAPVCLTDEVLASSRRWEQKGILNTVFTMWKLRLLFFFGEAPEKLVKHY